MDRGFSNGINGAKITDQAVANCLDIGCTRIQWGTEPSNGAATDTVALPAPFADVTYFPILQPWTGTNVLLGFNVVTKTTTNFTVRKKSSSGDSMTEAFDWIAIGKKP